MLSALKPSVALKGCLEALPIHPNRRDSTLDLMQLNFFELYNLDFSAWVVDIDFVTGDGTWNTVSGMR